MRQKPLIIQSNVENKQCETIDEYYFSVKVEIEPELEDDEDDDFEKADLYFTGKNGTK